MIEAGTLGGKGVLSTENNTHKNRYKREGMGHSKISLCLTGGQTGGRSVRTNLEP